jgi:hypothetical protein
MYTSKKRLPRRFRRAVEAGLVPETDVTPDYTPSNKVGWTVNQWCDDAGLGRSSVYLAMKAGVVKYVKCGTRTIITTSPREFLASLAEKAA